MQIAVVAALPAELAPLVRMGAGASSLPAPPGSRWERRGRVYAGEIRMPDGSLATAHACAAGMGAEAATRAFSELLEAGRADLQAVVSYGWAGALSCGVKPPEIYSVTEVIDSRTGERYTTAAPALAPSPSEPRRALRLVTLDHVARAEEKRPLAERYQAVLVDMEAATIARLARAHGLSFYCIKGISDGYTDVLPDFNRFLDRSGQLQVPALVAYALMRPRYWGPLKRLGSNSRLAARKLARHLPACFERSGLLS